MHNSSFPQPGTPSTQVQPPANPPHASTPPAMVPVALPAPQQPAIDAQAPTPNLLHPGAMTAQAQQTASVTAAPLLGASAGAKRNAPDPDSDQQTNGNALGAWGLPPGAMPMPSMPFLAGGGMPFPYHHGYGWFNAGRWGLLPGAMPMPFMPFIAAGEVPLPDTHGYGCFNQGGFDFGLPTPDSDADAMAFHGEGLSGPQGDSQTQGLPASSPSPSARSPEDELIRAASSGDEAAVRALLASGIDANGGDGDGITALMLAVEGGHEAIVRTLLAVPGINVHAEDDNGQTALQIAITEWQDGIERMILAALGEHTDTKGKAANAALISAVARDDEVAVRTLLANPDIDINSKEEFGVTALHVAASLGNQAIFRSLLAKRGIDVNVVDAAGRTALMRAGKKGHEDIVRELLDMPGIDINAYYFEENTESFSALEIAAKEGHRAIARALLASPGIDPESIDSSLYLAVEKGHQAIVEALLAMPGIEGNGVNDSSWSPLMRAVQNGDKAIVEVFLAMPGIDINLLEVNGLQTPLMCAVEKGHEAIVEAFLAMPYINVNATDRRGYTALMMAIQQGQESVVAILLAKPGIRIDVANTEGNTALSIAKSDGYDAIAEMLRNHVPASLAEPSTVLDLLQAIFTTHSGNPQQSASSSANITLHPSSASKELDNLCERLQFGKCAAADVPALFSSINSLPSSAHSALALALAFGFYTGHYRNAAGALDQAIAAAIAKAGLRTSFDDTVEKLGLAAKHINLCRIDGMNLLGIAARAGNERMIRGLVRLGAYVNVPSPNGKTALAIAVENRQWGACAELVFHGALPTLPLHDGYPALYHIVRDFNTDAHASESLALLIRYLRKKGVPFDILVKNPDETMRAERPTVPLYELLVTNAQSWVRFRHILFDLQDAAPPAVPAPATTAAIPGNALSTL